MTNQIEQLVEQIKARTRGKLNAFDEQRVDTLLGFINDIYRSVVSANDTLATALNEAKRNPNGKEARENYELREEKTVYSAIRALTK